MSVSRVNNRSKRRIRCRKKTLSRNRFLSIAYDCMNSCKEKTKKPKEDAESRSIGSANQKRFNKTSPTDQPIRSVPEDKSDTSLYGQVSFLIQSDQSRRTTSRTHRHTEKLPLFSNQNPLDGPLDDLQTTSSFCPIRILRTDLRTIFRRHFRLVQSESFGRTFGRSSDLIFVLSKQNPSDGPLDDLQTSSLSCPIRILRTDFRTIFRRHLCLVQSESFGIFISSNQNPSDGLSDNLQTSSSSRLIRILWTDFRTIFRRTIFVSSNNILWTDFRTIFRRTIFVSSNQNPSDRLSDDLQTEHLRLVQSHPSDRLSSKPSRDSSHSNGHGPHE